jgi:hypothetical protein
MGQRESTCIGKFLSAIKNVYSVVSLFQDWLCYIDPNVIKIILYFMGPQGLKQAVSLGGPMIDDFPANLANHIEGRLTQHWKANKAEKCAISDPDDVPRIVSLVIFNYIYTYRVVNRYGTRLWRDGRH